MKHTKGPWSVKSVRHKEHGLVLGVDAGQKHWICKIVPSGIDLAEEAANAKLIAAAPELLEALKNMAHELSVNYLMFMPEGPSMKAGKKIVYDALKAINKAEGE